MAVAQRRDNIDALMSCADVDGALVGGASLKADSFSRIVKFNRNDKNMNHRVLDLLWAGVLIPQR